MAGLLLICAASVLIPFLFYLPQLYSLPYFFPTLAVILFWIGSRRVVPIFAAAFRRRGLRAGLMLLVVLSITPWFVGLSAPRLRHTHLTLAHATEFPTGKGYQPMGAYLAYVFAARERGLVLDHNEETWIAAKSVNYQTCGGFVPVVDSQWRLTWGWPPFFRARIQFTIIASVTRIAASLMRKRVL